MSHIWLVTKSQRRRRRKTFYTGSSALMRCSVSHLASPGAASVAAKRTRRMSVERVCEQNQRGQRGQSIVNSFSERRAGDTSTHRQPRSRRRFGAFGRLHKRRHKAQAFRKDDYKQQKSEQKEKRKAHRRHGAAASSGSGSWASRSEGRPRQPQNRWARAATKQCRTNQKINFKSRKKFKFYFYLE